MQPILNNLLESSTQSYHNPGTGCSRFRDANQPLIRPKSIGDQNSWTRKHKIKPIQMLSIQQTPEAQHIKSNPDIFLEMTHDQQTSGQTSDICKIRNKIAEFSQKSMNFKRNKHRKLKTQGRDPGEMVNANEVFLAQHVKLQEYFLRKQRADLVQDNILNYHPMSAGGFYNHDQMNNLSSLSNNAPNFLFNSATPAESNVNSKASDTELGHFSAKKFLNERIRQRQSNSGLFSKKKPFNPITRNHVNQSIGSRMKAQDQKLLTTTQSRLGSNHVQSANNSPRLRLISSPTNMNRTNRLMHPNQVFTPKLNSSINMWERPSKKVSNDERRDRMMRSLSPHTDQMNELIKSSIDLSEIGKAHGLPLVDGLADQFNNDSIDSCLKTSIEKIKEIQNDLGSMMSQKNNQYTLQEEDWTEVQVQPDGFPTFARVKATKENRSIIYLLVSRDSGSFRESFQVFMSTSEKFPAVGLHQVFKNEKPRIQKHLAEQAIVIPPSLKGIQKLKFQPVSVNDSIDYINFTIFTNSATLCTLRLKTEGFLMLRTREQNDQYKNLGKNQIDTKHPEVKKVCHELKAYYIQQIKQRPKVTNFRLENKSLLSSFSPDMFEIKYSAKLKDNYRHRKHVEQRAQMQMEAKRQFFMDYLCRQDQYRETKIVMTKKYLVKIKNMKQMRGFVTLILARKWIGNLILLHRKFLEKRIQKQKALFIALKFKMAFKKKICQKLGPKFEDRSLNQIRRYFTFQGLNFIKLKWQNCRTIAGRFVKKFVKMRAATLKVEYFYNKILQIQTMWRLVRKGRQMKFDFMRRRIRQEHDIVLKHYYQIPSKRINKIKNSLVKLKPENRSDGVFVLQMIDSFLNKFNQINQLHLKMLYHSTIARSYLLEIHMVRAYINQDRKSQRLNDTVKKLISELDRVSDLTNQKKDLLTEIMGPSQEVIDSMVQVGVVGFWKVTKTAHPKSALSKELFRAKLVDINKIMKKDGVKQARENELNDFLSANQLYQYLDQLGQKMKKIIQATEQEAFKVIMANNPDLQLLEEVKQQQASARGFQRATRTTEPLSNTHGMSSDDSKRSNQLISTSKVEPIGQQDILEPEKMRILLLEGLPPLRSVSTLMNLRVQDSDQIVKVANFKYSHKPINNLDLEELRLCIHQGFTKPQLSKLVSSTDKLPTCFDYQRMVFNLAFNCASLQESLIEE